MTEKDKSLANEQQVNEKPKTRFQLVSDETSHKSNRRVQQKGSNQMKRLLNQEQFPVKPLTDLLSQQEIIKKLISAPQTDAGNAENFVLLHKDSLRYCKSRKKWLKWGGNIWKVDEGGEVHRAAIITVRAVKYVANFIKDNDSKSKLIKWAKDSESMARRSAMINTAMHLKPLETTVDDYDQNHLLAGVKNGTLDLMSGGFTESIREDYISMQFNVEYDPSATAPRWEQFLDEIFAGDKELISWIQRAVGYSLTGDISEQVMFILYGGGANGKSVFLEVLTNLLGDYAANTPFSTFEMNKRNEATNDLAALRGKRFITAIETNEDRRLDEARVKSVTGGDRITCRFLYGEYFTYRPSFKIWMAVNHKPLIKGTDRGIWRRICLIPFTQNFEGKADKELTSKLRAELSGILNWALAGLKDWKQQGIGRAKAIELASDEYRKESDLLQQWLNECITTNSNEKIGCTDAYNSFKEWSKSRGYPVFSMNSFSRAMTEKGYKSKPNGKRREYVGLKLDEPLV